MKIENLDQAIELSARLAELNNLISTAKAAIDLTIHGNGPGVVNIYNLEYSTNRDEILETVRKFFLDALNKEKQDILSQIETLD